MIRNRKCVYSDLCEVTLFTPFPAQSLGTQVLIISSISFIRVSCFGQQVINLDRGHLLSSTIEPCDVTHNSSSLMKGRSGAFLSRRVPGWKLARPRYAVIIWPVVRQTPNHTMLLNFAQQSVGGQGNTIGEFLPFGFFSASRPALWP